MGERKVFLSSTFKDLADYREAVYWAIQRMDDWRCVRMEDFGARDWEADEFCRKKVAECHLFVGILGLLYGSIHKPGGLSYTEREYQAAVNASEPRLMFLTPEDFPVPGNLMESSAKQRQQKAFRKRVSAERVLDANWTSPDQLATSVVTAIRNWEQEQARQEPPRKRLAPPPSTPDQQLRDRYLRWLAKTCGRLVLRGIRSPDGSYIELNLDDIYVSLEAVEILPPQERRPARPGKRETEMPERELPATRPLNLRDLLKVGPRIVVIGGPGSGKSTVLQHIAWTLATSLAENRPDLALERLGLSEPFPLPILVPLHTFAEHRARCRQATDPELSTLAACVFDYLTRDKGAPDLSVDFFKSLLKDGGNCLVMLDGLDEVASEAERELVCRAIENLADWAPGNRYIVTSRPAAYTGQAVIAAGFRQVQVKPLGHSEKRDDVGPLVTRLYQAAGHPERIQPLLTWLGELEARYARRPGGEEKRLIDSPLMVRMVAIVDLSGEKLPEQRAELYDRFVDALLRSTHHPDATVRQALEKMGGSAENQRQWLAMLAYAMHSQEAGTRSLEESQVRQLLCQHLSRDLGEKDAAAAVHAFIATIRSRGGLIDVRAGPPDRWSFTHQPFQEFLTAVYLADIANEVSTIAAELEKEGHIAQAWWQEVVLLLLGYLSHTPDKANRLARRLARLPDPAAPPWPPLDGAAQLAAAERVAVALIERPGTLPLLETEVARRLADLVTDPALTAPPVLRAAAGRALAHLDDPRPGVTFYVPSSRLTWNVEPGTRNFLWCPVPAGPFLMGTRKADIPALLKKYGGKRALYELETPQHEEKSITQPYLISRYPVTNAQFQAFVDDPDGYRNNRLWTKAGRQWRGQRTGPEKAGGVYDLPNHPVVMVTWYEAVAFCNWLNDKFHVPGSALRGSAPKGSKFHVWRNGRPETCNMEREPWNIRLPTEAEWEKAASWAEEQESHGAEGKKRLWSWGDEFNTEKCNMADTGIGSTCAVGLFPGGDSPYGCADMVGNVWEWCQSKWVANYQNYDRGVQERESLEGSDSRVMHGGAFNFILRFVRCACRLWYNPDDLYWNIGFRLVVSPGP